MVVKWLVAALSSIRPSLTLEAIQRDVVAKVGLICGSLEMTVDGSQYQRSPTPRGPIIISRDIPSTELPYPAIMPSPSFGWLGTLSDTTNDTDVAWDGFLWAVPKKRTSHSRKRMRMTHKYLKPKHHYQPCSKCGNLKLQHMLCGHCFKEIMEETARIRREQMAKLKMPADASKNADVVTNETSELLSYNAT